MGQNKISFERLNTILFTLIVAVNLMSVLLIFHPAIFYWWQSSFTEKEASLQKIIETPTEPTKSDPPAKPRLIIPKMLLNEEIFVGNDLKLVNKGVWLRPNTSRPENGSNTVLVGHRTSYSRSPVFYNLHKLQKGHKMAVIWENKKYNYEVVEIKEVGPNAVEIEWPTITPRLTLYSCSPIGTSRRRLVVIASRVSP